MDAIYTKYCKMKCNKTALLLNKEKRPEAGFFPDTEEVVGSIPILPTMKVQEIQGFRVLHKL